MFGGKDDALHAGIFAGANPLSGIQLVGVKECRVFVAETPFLIGLGVQ